MRFLYSIIFCFIIIGCADKPIVTEANLPVKTEALVTSSELKSGNWIVKLKLSEGNYIPFNLHHSNNKLVISNSSEKIECKINFKSDSFLIELPVFNSELVFKPQGDKLEGFWYNKSKGDYSIPISGLYSKDPSIRFNEVDHSQISNFQGKWESTFGLTDEPYKALGIFEQYNNLATGTFLTETGDYRFLQGNVMNDTLLLSCFDGAHAFLFKAYQKNDSLFGSFYSGNHYKDNWVAVKNETFQLKNPNELTTLIGSDEDVKFSFPGLEGAVAFPSEKYQGKVTLIQVFGSWCPNCMDEVKYYTELYEKYNEHGLEIIGLGFEVPKTLANKKKRIAKLVSDLNAPYDFAVGGYASKDSSKIALPFLSEVSSYPTTIFMDKNGKVRKIHTGFYGPGTGVYFQEYKKETELLIEQMLQSGI